MKKTLRALVVGDNPEYFDQLQVELKKEYANIHAVSVDTSEKMEAALDNSLWDIVFSDYALASFSAVAALALLKWKNIDLPFIVVSDATGEEKAIEAMRAGAHDYIMKGDLSRLIPAVKRELKEAANRRERERLECQLIQAQRIEAIGRLAGGIAHEFNNQLAIIITHAKLVQKELDPKSESYEDMGIILIAANRSATLTRQLLTFSQQQMYQPQVMDLNRQIEETGKMLSSMIGGEIELIFNLGKDLHRIIADAGQIDSMIMNMAVNARDAMPNGGRLVIETGKVQIKKSDCQAGMEILPGPYVMITVSDTGQGMDEDTMSRIFDPFFTTKDLGKGEGLGLSIAYGAIKQSGGHIEVQSELGKGTTFNIFFPATEKDFELAPAGPSADDLAQGERSIKTILVIDDEKYIIRAIQRALQDKGYVLLIANNSKEGQRICDEHRGPIHLALVDVLMPGMSGPELAEYVNKRRPETKILYMSGYPFDRVRSTIKVPAGAPILKKPFDQEILEQSIIEALR